MAIFDYKAYNQKGNLVKGKTDAPNEKAAKQILQGQSLLVESLKLAKESKKSGKSKKLGRVKSSVIANFTRQLATLQATGIPYDRSLEILIQESKDPAFLAILSDIKAKITEGQSLAQAMDSLEGIFPKLYIAMVRAGEAGGRLAYVLEKLAKYLEEQEALKSKIQGAMIYPTIMILLGLGIVTFMMTFILPKITPIFEQFDAELPLPTRIVIATSEIISQGWWAFLIAAVVMVAGTKKYLKTKKGEYNYHRLLLNIPVLKELLSKIYQFRFTQTMAALMSSGVDLKQSLAIVSLVMGNQVYEQLFVQITEDITKKGLDLSQALRKTGFFSATLIQMIRVGEESSQLEQMLEKVADNFEKDVAQAIEKGIALLEPLMIILMAVMVGFIVLAVMLPMFELNQML